MIGFIGLSHLGMVSGIVAAAKGDDVVAYDPNALHCGALSRGQFPIAEPGLSELFAAARARIRFTHRPEELAGCSLLVCSADVPTMADNHSDLAPITQLVQTALSHAASGAVLVILSQVPPGFTRQIAQAIGKRGGQPLAVFYQVETLVFGHAVERAQQPERIIVGCSDPHEALPSAYAAWLQRFACPIVPMRYESAELAKVAINLFLTSSVCTANMLAQLCEVIGADWSEIIPALRLDRRIGPYAYLAPGLGLSGGNLERDLITVRELAQRDGTDAGLIEAWLAQSHARRDWPLRILHDEVLSRIENPVIAMWGLAYKPNTHSTKNAPALALIEALRSVAIQAYDPQAVVEQARYPHVRMLPSALAACRGADALAVMSPWPEFSSVRPAQIRELMRGRVIIDPFGALDRKTCVASGLRHWQLGVPAPLECSRTDDEEQEHEVDVRGGRG